MSGRQTPDVADGMKFFSVLRDVGMHIRYSTLIVMPALASGAAAAAMVTRSNRDSGDTGQKVKKRARAIEVFVVVRLEEFARRATRRIYPRVGQW